LLILNDAYLKHVYHNPVTGKLSDFAGLFAFPFFLSVVLRINMLWIHLGTAILFVWWKSPLSTDIIAFMNTNGIPIGRTIDGSDNIALVSVLISYGVLSLAKVELPKSKLLAYAIAIISLTAFTATSVSMRLVKYPGIDKEYHFKLSKQKLVSALNGAQLMRMRRNLPNAEIDFHSRNDFFQGRRGDTLVTLLDYREITDTDTIRLRTHMADVKIGGDSVRSSLILLQVYSYQTGFLNKERRERLVKRFEKSVVRKIQNLE
jgi:hypothetical protein